MTEILTYHVVPGRVYADQALEALELIALAMQRTHDMSDRAWTLRYALDETMQQMG